MGLKTRFNLEDFGYPPIVTATVTIGTAVGFGSAEVDYSEAFSAFRSTFMDVIEDLTPVDTGYLKSSVSTDSDGMSSCSAVADAEYAQYVEYGTWKMEPQPYFVPALEAAMAEFHAAASMAVQWAKMEARIMANEMAQIELEMQAAENAQRETMGVGGGAPSIGQTFMMLGVLILLAPIILIGMAVSDALGIGEYGMGDADAMVEFGEESGYGGIPEVEIF